MAGVWVEHRRLCCSVRGTNLKTLPESPSDVFLKAFVRSTLNGTVRDSNGQPLEGVTVSSGDARIQTARDGTYALPSPKGAFVKFAKAGYVTRELILPQLRKDGRVTLERQVALTGKVLGPDGRPVENFEVLAGPGQSTKDLLSDPEHQAGVQGTRRGNSRWHSIIEGARGSASAPRGMPSGRCGPTLPQPVSRKSFDWIPAYRFRARSCAGGWPDRDPGPARPTRRDSDDGRGFGSDRDNGRIGGTLDDGKC